MIKVDGAKRLEAMIKLETALNEVQKLIEASSKVELLNKITGLNIKDSQAEAIGYRLTHEQNTKVLDLMLKKHGQPDQWYQKGHVIHRQWSVEGHDISIDFSIAWDTGLINLES